jgi:hypothetical protein
MTEQLDCRHLKHEADSIDEKGAALHLPGDIPRTERIESQPRESYRPPSFLRNSAGAKEYADLCEYLEELWPTNEEHVGQYVTEVEVYLALSGEYHFLRDCLMEWCRQYFLRRVSRDNPKDKNDPFEKFTRLVEEGDKVFGHLERRAHTVNCVFLNEAWRYAVSLLFERTWKAYVQRIDHDKIAVTRRPVSQSSLSQTSWWRMMRRG